MEDEHRMLGDRAKTRFDPNLARMMNERADAEEKRRKLEDRLRPKPAEPKAGEVKPKARKNSSSNVSPIDDYLVIPDIQCVGADGKVFESYDRIYVARDVVRDGAGKHVSFTPYRAISHFENNNQFLPSFALSCNVLAYLFANKSDKDINNVLMQYKDHGSGYGWHAQNTSIDWKGRKIRHSPLDEKFPNDGGNDGVNQSRQRNDFGFKAKDFGNMALDDALKKTEFNDFIVNLTGLENPGMLVEIGKYFGKPARILVPNNPSKAAYTSASWLGCNSDCFIISGLVNVNAARGVREP